ncbi:MAG: hypothetical protein H7X99_08330 [Saprospiraceae bacterium]|nr:hypothetical protein [Saprospiraceae bacterium]
MNKLPVLIFATICMYTAHAQKYNTLGGIRIADDFGISFAQRIANKTTVELNHQPGTFAGRELTSLIIKQHYPLLTKRFNFFMGAGVYNRKVPSADIENPDAVSSKGIAFSFGAELSLGRLSISTDYFPLVTFNKTDNNQRFYTTSGFSLRYILFRRESGIMKFFKKIF